LAQVKHGDTVKIKYSVTLDDGTVFFSNLDSDPVEITIGKDTVIPGLEEALLGMNQGESKKVSISSDKGFGAYDPGLVKIIDRNEFLAGVDLEVGKELQISQAGKMISQYTITDISGSSVTLDGNHPLAGKDLSFDVQLVEIVKASN
jgi:FKBP-type peptidyl-prolyl cis-trans isomerase 2